MTAGSGREVGSIPTVSDAPQGLRVLVIVPAWNEQASITGTLAEIRECVPWADLLVVDDGSGDRTAETAEAAGATVCRLPFNLGVGGAMRTGYRYALRNGYDAAVQIDADGQHDPRFLADLLARLQDADVVIGARFAKADDPYVVRGPRRWAMVLLARVLSRLAHTRLTDVTSGFRVSNRRAIVLFAQHYPAEYLGDTVESLVIAARAGLPDHPGAGHDARADRRARLALAREGRHLPLPRRGRADAGARPGLAGPARGHSPAGRRPAGDRTP